MSRHDRSAVSTERVSRTAAAVALGARLAADDAELAHLIPPDARRLAQLVIDDLKPLGRPMARSLEYAAGRRTLRRVVEEINPGIVAQYALRKHWIDGRVRGAIADGARRVLLLAAGYDVLGLRLARDFPDVGVVELDRALTLAAKRDALARLAELPANLTFHDLDLEAGAGWEELAPRLGIGEADQVLVVAEGVTMYLTPGAVTRAFAAIRGLSHRPVDLLWTFLDADPGFIERSQRARTVLRRLGEPVQWAHPAADIVGWLSERGFDNLALLTAADLAQAAGLPATVVQTARRQPEVVGHARARTMSRR